MPNASLMDKRLSVTLKSQSREETFSLGEIFGQTAKGGKVIALIGDLGAGKTQFVQGLAKGLDVSNGTVNSPTFSIVQEYEGRLPLAHVDLYRLENLDAIAELGLEDYFDEAGISAIEWADKGEAILPKGRLNLYLRDLEGDQREIVIQATDSQHQSWLAQVSQNKTVLPLIDSAKDSA